MGSRIRVQGAKQAHVYKQSHLKVLGAMLIYSPPEATMVQSLNCSMVLASTFCPIVNPGHSAVEESVTDNSLCSPLHVKGTEERELSSRVKGRGSYYH